MSLRTQGSKGIHWQLVKFQGIQDWNKIASRPGHCERTFTCPKQSFLHHGNDESSRKIGIDIFTTSAEIPFAGHADQRHYLLFFLRRSGATIRFCGIDFTLHTKAGAPWQHHFDHGTRSKQQQIFRTIMSSFIRHPFTGSTYNTSLNCSLL